MEVGGRVQRQFFVFLLATQSFTAAVEKYWLPDLEWQTGSNWLDNHVPDIDSHVIFPLETRHAVGIKKTSDLQLSGIDLARSGALALARDGKILITKRKDAAKISKWNREGHFFWADPENWNGSSTATPHFERVPCVRDDVVLPGTDRTFSLLLPIKEVQVRSVRMSNEKFHFTSWEWENLQKQREFTKGRSIVKYSWHSCDKCECDENRAANYLEEICAIERPKCGLPACEYPLQVEGHCCPYCGGRISVSKKTALYLIQITVDEAIEGYKEKVSWYVRRAWKGDIEVLLKEKGVYSGIDVIESMESVKGKLLGVNAEILSFETAGGAMADSRLAVSLGPMFGAPLIILVLLLIGFLYFGYTLQHILSGCRDTCLSIRNGIRSDKSQSKKPFGFARFENIPEGNVQIADAPGTSEQSLKNGDDVADTSRGGRFENPLYKSKRRKEEERKILDMEAPLSLSTLSEKMSADPVEEVEMNIDQ